MRHLIIALTDTDEVVGRLHLYSNGRTADIWFSMAPWLEDADSLQAETLRLVIPWLRDEASMVMTTLEIPSDQNVTIAAARELGMPLAVRLREHIARPGHRVDLLLYQAPGPVWTYPEEAKPCVIPYWQASECTCVPSRKTTRRPWRSGLPLNQSP
jgi:hypothetical protein